MELMIKKISAKMINRNDGTMIRVYFPPGESAFADKTPHAPQIKQHAQIEKHQKRRAFPKAAPCFFGEEIAGSQNAEYGVQQQQPFCFPSIKPLLAMQYTWRWDFVFFADGKEEILTAPYPITGA